MKKISFCILGYLFLLVFVFSSKILAQGMAIPGISPSMLAEFSTMPPDQRRELAAQYGINLDDFGLGNEGGEQKSIGLTGDNLESEVNKVIVERIIDAQENTKKAEEYRRENIPLFGKDYSSIDNLPVFGQFLFDGGFSTFAPIDNSPVPNNYVIGPGDSLRLLLYGVENLQTDLIVNREGNINFPELGEISIAGMNFPDANEYIKSRVSKEMMGVEVSISMGRLRSINVFISIRIAFCCSSFATNFVVCYIGKFCSSFFCVNNFS